MTALKFRAPIQRSNPFDHFVNDFFEGEFRGKTPVSKTTKPSANIYEARDAFRIELLAPGFSKEEFSIEVNDDLLLIKAKRVTQDSEEKVLRNEFNISQLERRFKLNEDIDKENIEADYKDGVLVLNLKKKEVDTREKHRVISVK